MFLFLGMNFTPTYSTHFFPHGFPEMIFAYSHFCTYFWCLLHSHAGGVLAVMKNTALELVCQRAYGKGCEIFWLVTKSNAFVTIATRYCLHD